MRHYNSPFFKEKTKIVNCKLKIVDNLHRKDNVFYHTSNNIESCYCGDVFIQDLDIGEGNNYNMCNRILNAYKNFLENSEKNQESWKSNHKMLANVVDESISNI